MPTTDQIVQLLIAERDRLEQAINLLTAGTTHKRRGRPPGSKNNMPDWVTGNGAATSTAPAPARKKRRRWSAAERKAAADRARKMWVERKKAAAKKIPAKKAAQKAA